MLFMSLKHLLKGYFDEQKEGVSKEQRAIWLSILLWPGLRQIETERQVNQIKIKFNTLSDVKLSKIFLSGTGISNINNYLNKNGYMQPWQICK